jgi:hypothetical protein
MDERDVLRTAIAGAVGAVLRGDEDDALVRFGRLAHSSGLGLRDSVLELAGANVEMLLTITGHDTDEDVLVTLSDEVDEADQDEPHGIDDTEPAQRATARVLLALANGHSEDAEAQLDIVAAAPNPDETGHVFAHTMSWTLELLDICADTGQPVPDWLEPALSRS